MIVRAPFPSSLIVSLSCSGRTRATVTGAWISFTVSLAITIVTLSLAEFSVFSVLSLTSSFLPPSLAFGSVSFAFLPKTDAFSLARAIFH